MSHDVLPPFLQALLQPACYDHPVPDLRLVQTHISSVILAGDFVYKFKKPVNFGFLDFSDLAKRRACCEQELLLNRRLCPDIYLGLVRVTAEPGGRFALNGSGEVVEYGVKMVRMPEERMMTRLIRDGELTEAHIDALVEVLAGFYAQAAGGPEIAAFGTAAAVGVNVVENFDQTQGFIGQGALNQEQFDHISDYARTFLAREALFQQRIDGGYIRDCHGDLYSANICLADKVYIYDCIEFNQRFRYCDVASDVAFLAMDLDFYGLDHLATRLIDRFARQTKDDGLGAMLNFYKCYRAYVRGKIGLFTAADPAVDAAVKASCLANAAKYFALAARYAGA
jgi:aminoglycoside phosphotransferase family enzyme